MPRVIITATAQQDLERLRQFLHTKNPNASKRAAKAIKDSIKELTLQPEAYRPVLNMPFHREILIKFGARGFVARYFYKPGGDILVLRLKHQLEDELPRNL
jgi:plasmid stabilization system protein ParE